jgi:predicted TIM-barrel fold metal-dependent hydrolase
LTEIETRMIIDAHTHRYPDEVIANPQAFALRTGEEGWLKMVSPQDRPSLQGWADRDQMLADMDAAGVDRCALLGWYWENYETCIEANNWHLLWMKQDPGRFFSFLSIKPDIPFLEDYLKQAHEDGFQGIGESHPWVQGFSMRNKEWMVAMEFACSHDWPVNFHVTDPAGHDYPGKTLTPMDEFLWLAKELPDLKIVLAHAGALYALENTIPDNFYFDLAACPLLYPPNIYQKLISCTGAERILWGTDYPLRIYPKAQNKPDFHTFLEELKRSLQVRQDQLDDITGGNFLKLCSED